MSQFTKTSSDLRPVVNVDSAQNTTAATLNEVTSGVTVNLAGPKLQFGTITKGSGAFTGDQIQIIIQTLSQTATVYMYQYTDDSNDSLAVATYPAGALDFANTGAVDADITAALGSVAVTTAATATFTG